MLAQLAPHPWIWRQSLTANSLSVPASDANPEAMGNRAEVKPGGSSSALGMSNCTGDETSIGQPTWSLPSVKISTSQANGPLPRIQFHSPVLFFSSADQLCQEVSMWLMRLNLGPFTCTSCASLLSHSHNVRCSNSKPCTPPMTRAGWYLAFNITI